MIRTLAAACLLASALLQAPSPVEAKMFFDPAGSGVLYPGPRQGPILSPTDFPTLIPGSAYGSAWAAIATPAAQGDSTALGFNEPAIAGWDTPQLTEVNAPYTQASTGAAPLPALVQKRKICLDAYHVNGLGSGGIRKVSASLNNGPWADLTAPLTTVEAGVPEWCFYVDQSKFGADSRTEVRAIVTPVAGVPRVLQGGDPLHGTGLLSYPSLWGYATVTTYPSVYYVSATGVDNGSCGRGTGSAACASVGYAATLIGNYYAQNDIQGYVCIVDNSPVSNGVPTPYAGAINMRYVQTTGRYVNVQPCGNSATKAGVVVKLDTNVDHDDKVHYSGLTILGQAGLPGDSSSNGYRHLWWFDNVVAKGNGIPGVTGGVNARSVTLFAGITYDSASQATSMATTYFLTDSAVSGYGNPAGGAILARGNSFSGYDDDVLSKTLQAVNNRLAGTVRSNSGPFTIASISSDRKTLTVSPQLPAGTLYQGDCLDNVGQATTGWPSCVLGNFTSLTADQDNATNAGVTTLTLSAAAPTAATVGSNFIQNSTNHMDITQWTSGMNGVPDAVIFVNNRAVVPEVGQQIFTDGIGFKNSAFVSNNFDNTATAAHLATGVPQPNGNNIGGPITNVLMQDNTFTGGVRREGGLSSVTDWVVRRDVCNNGVLRGSYRPVYDASPTCAQ